MTGEAPTATDINTEFTNFLANALSLVSPLGADLDMAGFKVSGLAAGYATGDAMRFEQNVPATQAEMEARVNLTAPVTPGRQRFHPSAAKAWAFADTAGGLTASYKMASVTDTSAGFMTFALTDNVTNICPIGCGDSNGNALAWRTRTSLELIANQYSTGVATDGASGSIVVFGDLA